ncbi:MAG: DUF3987 domain-containing protein [Phycisphaeraceae bacterium]|nr:MAG: DUF3987 domain-containing protein [Phycisphaeraceae bacterium]
MTVLDAPTGVDGHRSVVDAARSYLARNLMPVPIPARMKGPVEKGWPEWRFTHDNIALHFGGDGNIGLILGEPSGHLVDVDLDCAEAIEWASAYLPPTAVVTGRAAKPGSHWWYRCPGIVTTQFRDPKTSKMMVELRGTGVQTVVGPSIHPDGDVYDMLDGEPTAVEREVLEAGVRALVRKVLELRGHDPDHFDKIKRAPASHALVPVEQSAETIKRRAIAYLEMVPGAISGCGGHAQTYAAATALVHGFGLDPDVALAILLERYNPRCEPPWTERELRHKVEDAASKTHRMPFGWLRDAGPDATGQIDLSGLMGGEVAVAGTEDAMMEIDIGEPETPADPHPDPGPMPEHLLDVPGLIGEVMAFNLSTATRAQPILSLAGAIALQSVLAGRKVRDERGNRTNLYIVGVASSGAGKDHARRINKSILAAANLMHLEGNEDLASDAGLVTAAVQSPAILFQLDEFGRFLRTTGDARKSPHLHNVVTVLMRLYSSADVVFKSKAYADDRRNQTIDQPCVVLLGTTVPQNFFESLTAESITDGFMARLLVFETDDMPERTWGSVAEVPEPIVEAADWWGAFTPGNHAGGSRPQPLVVKATPEAQAVFDSFAARIDIEMRMGNEVARSLWARTEEKACRLALVYACSANRERPQIDAAAAQWACDLSEHLTRRMLHLASRWVTEGAFDARVKRVVRILTDAGGTMSASDLTRKTQWMSVRERRDVMDHLVEAERLSVRTEPTKSKPRTVYELKA